MSIRLLCSYVILCGAREVVEHGLLEWLASIAQYITEAIRLYSVVCHKVVEVGKRHARTDVVAYKPTSRPDQQPSW